jgi:hypothetical protein
VNDNAKVGSERPRQDIIPASTGVR